MQQKQHNLRLPLFLTGLALLIVGGLGALMATDVPAPQTVIEKPLDAQAFLGHKN